MQTYEDEPKEKPKKAKKRPEDMTPGERANLALFFEEEEAKGESMRVRTGFDTDIASRAPRMKKAKLLNEMYALVAKPKNFPFQNAANVKTPALTGPELQIEARLFQMLIPDDGKIMRVVPRSSESWEQANLGEMFANSYLRYEMPYWEQGMEDTIHQACLYGSSFRRTSYDPRERNVRCDWVPLEDFVVSQRERSEDPSMRDVPRYSYVMRMTRDELEDTDPGYFVNLDKVKDSAAADSDVTDGDYRQSVLKIDGIEPPSDTGDKYAKRQIIEQHYRCKLPNRPKSHPSFDGKLHWVVATIDAWSGQLLRFAIREEDDPKDRLRYDREMQTVDQYVTDKQRYVSELEAFSQQLAAPPPPIMGDMSAMPMDGGMDMTQPPMMGGGMDSTMPGPMQPPAPPVEPPPPPLGLEDDGQPKLPRPVRKRQICFFTHYRCFPSDGFYGLGYGDLLYGLALAMNTLLNQHIDGSTLKNAKPGFISRQARMQRGSVNVQPGSFIELDLPPEQLRNAVFYADPPGNDPTTVPLVQMLDGMKDAMVGAADTFAGEIPKSNQTADGISKLIEQATTSISTLGKRFKRYMTADLEKIWRCFGVFLEDSELVDVIDENGQPKEITIGRDMFSPLAKLEPTADPRLKSQRMSDHQALTQFVTGNPYIMNSPARDPIMRELTMVGLQIMPDGRRLIPLLPPEQPQPPPPPPPALPHEEEAGWLNGQDHPVHPDDDDMMHMQSHDMFVTGPLGQRLDKAGRDMYERHQRAHAAQLHMKGSGNGQPGAGPGGPGAPGAGGPPAAVAGPQGGGPSGMEGGPAGPPPDSVPPGGPPANAA